ncbi:MAG: 30S ribosomal protein S14 [Promethearchaeota archaeon]
MPQTKKFGKGQRICRRCGTHRGLIRSYGLYICRRCFYEVGKEIGWKRYE